ncbi:hypothetical protein [Psychrobacillus lasiicapitis]|uniref:hypothetical protein n=1 Tax=Psychrobacillus lasiicapitis TaxID=1636719 RepID=UPI0014774613|nr:hypothetical protein [Psychrobacillus lasiicapitis]GGA31957.1 hypothetical protein GCM10011384_21890 [Psychrobacillus lasiicapitis]
MIKKPIKLSRESERLVLIRELQIRGIQENNDGQALENLDYFSLLSMLALKKAVES